MNANISTEPDWNSYKCSDRGLLLPLISEYTWPIWVRAVLYFTFLLYLFLGIAKIADIFMTSIEQITSVRKKIKFTNINGEEDFIEKKVWNDTVANLSLMALGSSCPEILLAIIEIVGNKFTAGELGPGTIVGSAAYNLLIISGLCVMAISSPGVRRIENYAVFIMTTTWSIFAYIWLFLVLSVITPDVVDLWEAILTLAFFGVLVVLSYMAEKNFYLGSQSDEEDVTEDSEFDSKALRQFVKHLNEYTLSETDKEKLILKYLAPTVKTNALTYRIKAVKYLTGSNIGIGSFRKELCDIYNSILNNIESNIEIKNEYTSVNTDFKKESFKSIIEFSSPMYIVKPQDGRCTITLLKKNCINSDIKILVSTKNGSAENTIDYVGIDYQEYEIINSENELKITIELLDSQKLTPRMFFAHFEIDEKCLPLARSGSNKSCIVMISNSEATGQIEFAEQAVVVKESAGHVKVSLIRKNGASGEATAKLDTYDITATNRVDYEGFKGKLLKFENGEVEKSFEIKILDDRNKEEEEKFGIRLIEVDGAKIGDIKNMYISIEDDDDIETQFRQAMRKIKINPDYLLAQKLSWIDQFKNAANVNEGDVENASAFDYMMHVISFPWKIMFAFLPPPGLLNGWVCFVVTLAAIGVMTALVGDAAAIFGCLINLKDSITAISFVAMGTSLPDTFASYIAADSEKTADNAIGNVTGSNCVNVFLGLGLPWVVAAIYWQAKGLPFTVKAGDLSFSIIIFSICCVICITTLVLRRYLSCFGKGELGGPVIPKFATGIFFSLLWVFYIVISALKAYEFF